MQLAELQIKGFARESTGKDPDPGNPNSIL